MRSKPRTTLVLRLLEAAAITALTITLFLAARKAALEERGYAAMGGEYCLLMMPLLWAGLKATLKDIKKSLFVSKGDKRHES